MGTVEVVQIARGSHIPSIVLLAFPFGLTLGGLFLAVGLMIRYGKIAFNDAMR